MEEPHYLGVGIVEQQLPDVGVVVADGAAQPPAALRVHVDVVIQHEAHRGQVPNLHRGEWQIQQICRYAAM